MMVVHPSAIVWWWLVRIFQGLKPKANKATVFLLPIHGI